MASLTGPTQVNVVTKEGECKLHIVIDLNINLNTNKVEINSKQIDEEEQPEWAIPSFKAAEKIKFGKG